ncbi:MAG: hypothetical protein DI563_11105 [Variovorax paradoxus]|uniref:Uncharacterized protein n=1 Tax=Variovorax paradoxus TaxID=34073 RepID=A0A2W5QC03_VARPD|nr:MAG: hypothetical protein DI563_11105 [Variovorax paradoxus]
MLCGRFGHFLFMGLGLAQGRDAGAGMCARRRTYFLLLRQKKVGKEKATLLAASDAGGVRCRTRYALRAALEQLQRVRSRSSCCRTRHSCHPASATSQAHPEGTSIGPSLRSALGGTPQKDKAAQQPC